MNNSLCTNALKETDVLNNSICVVECGHIHIPRFGEHVGIVDGCVLANTSCFFLHKLNQRSTSHDVKVEYHANENPLKYSEKNSIYWSTINVSNNQK